MFPLFILDPHFAKPEKIGALRYRFMLQTIACVLRMTCWLGNHPFHPSLPLTTHAFTHPSNSDLDANLRKIGSRLFVVKGTPEEALPRLWAEWRATRLTFESDTEPYAKRCARGCVGVVWWCVCVSRLDGWDGLFLLCLIPLPPFIEPPTNRRDRDICRLAQAAGVQVFTSPSHTLHDPEAYLAKLKGAQPPIAYQSFIKLFLSMGAVGPVGLRVLFCGECEGLGIYLHTPRLHRTERTHRPQPQQQTHVRWPPPWTRPSCPRTPAGSPPTSTRSRRWWRWATRRRMRRYVCVASTVHDTHMHMRMCCSILTRFIGKPTGALPRRRDGGDRAHAAVPGQEAVGRHVREGGWIRLGVHLSVQLCTDKGTRNKSTTHTRTHAQPKTSPNALEPATTVLSPYLKHGALSPKLFYHELQKVWCVWCVLRYAPVHIPRQPSLTHPHLAAIPIPTQVYAELKGKHSQPPVSLMGQLLWREFYYLAGHGVPNFDKMVGNPICKQIPWGR